MPIDYGLTPTGFNTKPLSVIQAELDAGLRQITGDSAGTEADGSIPNTSIAGQVKVFLADGFSAIWELLEVVWTSFSPGTASAASLDAISSINGTFRELPAFSSAVVTCTGTPGTILLVNRVVTVQVAGSRFTSVSQQTIAALSAWVALTPYLVGARVTNANRAYICITAGTSAGAGGPTTVQLNITDGTVHWRYLGEGTGAVDVSYKAEVSGPIGALTSTLTQIATPVSGWRNAVNLLDADVGANRETDQSLRLRREAANAAAGNATPDAIRANVLAVNEGSTDPLHLPVTACRVFRNDTDITDGNGLTPHSVEVLVRGAPDADVAAAVFASVGAGIKTIGSTVIVVVDSAGNNQTVRFSRPAEVPIWIIANVSYDPSEFPLDLVAGANLIEDAILLYGNAYDIGLSVRSSALSAQIFDGPTVEGGTPVPGILDVTSLLIGLSNPPTLPTTITINTRQLATFDSARITVNLTPGIP